MSQAMTTATDGPFLTTPLTSALKTTLALETLINAEAHLLAEHGAKGILKEGPEKRAAQSIDFARARVIAALIRERAAELSGKTLAQIEAESSEAALEAVVELEKQKERDVTKEEERQNHRERMCVDA